MSDKTFVELSHIALAETAFTITLREFPEDTGDNHPVFRLSNLFRSEIDSFLEIWSDRIVGTRLEKVKLVISHDGEGLYPSEFIADPNNSITYYRNNNRNGLLYIETSPVSDEQGLRNFFTLRDVNFLDGQFDRPEDEFFVVEELVHSAWRQASKLDDRAPRIIIDQINLILRSLRENQRSVPLRPFVRFCTQIALERCDPNQTFDIEDTKAIVGRALVELSMFPDEYWAANSSPAKISRHLFLNWQHADLVGSGGVDLDGDALALQASQTDFLGIDGAPIGMDEQNEWRRLCSDYCTVPNQEKKSQIPYAIFEQLFTKDNTGMKLGERVENELLDEFADRIQEWNTLSVKFGLDRKDQFDAQKFLDAEPEDTEKAALRDLISPTTKKMIEKAANPATQSISNPLIKLAEIVHSFASGKLDEIKDDRLRVRMSLGKLSSGSVSTLGLLSFIYGPTLISLAETSRIGSDGFELEVDECFTTQAPPPKLRTELEDDGEAFDEEISEEVWGPVPLVFEIMAPRKGNPGKFDNLEIEAGFQWWPSNIEILALFRLLTTCDDAPDPLTRLEVPNHQSFSEWKAQAIGRTTGLLSLRIGEYPHTDLADPLVLELKEILERFREGSKLEGLSQELLFDIFDRWLTTSDRFRAEFVPSGKSDGRTEIFVNAEIITINSGNGLLMLPSHPIRLRWIAKYLERSEQLASRALAGQLELNRENSDLYLDWISSLTPHQQPALAIGKNQETFFATSELGWAELFSPLESSTGREVGVDEHSATEIAHQISLYLLAHPHKSEGLSLMIILPKGAALPAKLLTMIRKGEWKYLSVDVNVVAPQVNWPEIVKEFEKLPVEDRMSNKDALLPPLQLRLYDLLDADGLGTVLSGVKCDIGVIPQFVADDVQLQDDTITNLLSTGSFDALLDNPTVLEGGGTGESITVSKLPAQPDQALETWSTIVVRHRRTRPVAVEMPGNTDQVKLMIDFRKEAELFELMHKLNHWVITIERHISREQIENLEVKPDILTVKENVGSSGLYTLVISSNSGKEYSIQRLERKLMHVLGEGFDGARRLAEKIYEEARSLAPSLALQAMGISRITEEMLGLVIAKHIAASIFPATNDNTATIWISLDDHAEWFGGLQGTRADLCRLSFRLLDGSLEVSALVVEGKFRKVYDAHGEAQVRRTLKLFEDILSNRYHLGPTTEHLENVDCDLWRTKILNAADSAGPAAKSFSGDMLTDAKGSSMILPIDIRQRFRAGDFSLVSLQGLFSICIYEKEGEPQVQEIRDGLPFNIVKTYRNVIVDLIEDFTLPFAAEVEAGAIPELDQNSRSPETAILNLDPVTRSKSEGIATGSVIPNSTSATAPNPAVIAARNRLSSEVLGHRYQAIVDKLAEFGVSVKAADDPHIRFTEGPATVMYRVVPGSGVTPNSISQKSDSLKLALRLKEEQEIRFSIDEGYVTIDVPKSDDDRYFVAAEELWQGWTRESQALSCPIGIDRSGNSVEINFSSSNSPHLLIGGTTGSGKSEALNTILSGLIHKYSANELRLLLIDPKGTELEMYEDAEHLEGMIGMDDDDANDLLTVAVEEMQARYKLLKSERTRSISEYNNQVSTDRRMPWWLIVLDEYADLTSDPDAKKKIEANLKRLAQKARAAGIHVIIATQKPSAEVISTNLRSNLPAQLALRVKNGTESRVVMDELGAETLNGKGDAFLKSQGKLTRVQCAMVSS